MASYLRKKPIGVCGVAGTFLAMICGCPPGGPVATDVPSGPPRELPEIVSVISANAAKLDRPLWSNSVRATARIKDEKGKLHVYNLDSTLLFEQPRSLRMDLRPGLGDPVMGVGSNNEEYWLWVEPELHLMRWGRHKFVGRPCNEHISMRPDQLVAALAVGGLPSTIDGLMGPIRKAGKKHDILEYIRMQSGNYVMDREYWVERNSPYLVRVVQFRDVQGRVSMSAALDDYKMVWDGGPLVPHSINVIWPQDESTFTLDIGKLTGKAKGEVSPRAFLRPEADKLPAGVTDVVQIDRDCD